MLYGRTKNSVVICFGLSHFLSKLTGLYLSMCTGCVHTACKRAMLHPVMYMHAALNCDASIDTAQMQHPPSVLLLFMLHICHIVTLCLYSYCTCLAHLIIDDNSNAIYYKQ